MTHSTDTAEGSLDVLAVRARALAQPLESSLDDRPRLELLDFESAGERYGIELRWIRGTSRLVGWTPVPGTPKSILGVVNLRGEVLSLVELGALLGRPPGPPPSEGYGIRLSSPEMEFCIWAQTILGSRWVSRDEIQPPPSSGTPSGTEIITGVSGDCLNLVDGGSLFSHPDLALDPDGWRARGS